MQLELKAVSLSTMTSILNGNDVQARYTQINLRKRNLQEPNERNDASSESKAIEEKVLDSEL